MHHEPCTPTYKQRSIACNLSVSSSLLLHVSGQLQLPTPNHKSSTCQARAYRSRVLPTCTSHERRRRVLPTCQTHVCVHPQRPSHSPWYTIQKSSPSTNRRAPWKVFCSCSFRLMAASLGSGYLRCGLGFRNFTSEVFAFLPRSSFWRAGKGASGGRGARKARQLQAQQATGRC